MGRKPIIERRQQLQHLLIVGLHIGVPSQGNPPTNGLNFFARALRVSAERSWRWTHSAIARTEVAVRTGFTCGCSVELGLARRSTEVAPLALTSAVLCVWASKTNCAACSCSRNSAVSVGAAVRARRMGACGA